MANEVSRQPINASLRKLLLTKSAVSKDTRKHQDQCERSRVNYERRSRQFEQCGYQSSITQPYQELGDVVLDNQELILRGLGQEGWKLDSEETSTVEEDDFHVNDGDSNEKGDDHSKTEVDKLKTIDEQLKQGLDILKKVRLGRSLFDLLEKERLEKERIRREKEEKESWERKMRMVEPNHVDYVGDTSDSDDSLSSVIIPSPMPSRLPSANSTLSQRISSRLTVNNDAWGERGASKMENTLSPSRIPSNLLHRELQHSAMTYRMLNTEGGERKKKTKKRRHAIRPFSPLYTNLNFNKVENRDSLFRQLCVVNWILEAMSQDNNPPIMPSVTSSWDVRDLRQETKLLQKRVERDNVVEPIWQSFLTNPSRYQFRQRRKSTKFIPASRRSSIQFNLLKQEDISGALRKSSVHSQVSQSGRRGSNSSKHISLPSKDKLSESQTDQWGKLKAATFDHQRRPSLADVVIMASHNKQQKQKVKTSTQLAQLSSNLKENFDDIQTEQAIILHDNLELHERNRNKNFEKKFHSLKVVGNLYVALKTLRQTGDYGNNNNNVTIDDVTSSYQSDDERTVAIAEDLERSYETCAWYLTLTQHLSDDVKNEKNITMILKKIQRFCDLGGRKVSTSHFVRALSILRPFELRHPDISAAIEFVRDKIVSMERKDFEMWCKKHTKQMERPVSRV
uniref:Uncharacterized protein n=2 Tax=Clytia hemisphaerica TaxID=252671 RepID=A0A7M5VBE9_9CNID